MARKDAKDRGLFERPAGSNIWWVRYTDANGEEHRVKVGMKRAAQMLYRTRKREAREGLIKPAKLKVKRVTFAEITEDNLKRSKAENASWKDDESRGKDLLAEFGKRPAEDIKPREITEWLYRFQEERKLAPSTINKYRALMSAIFSHAVEGERLNVNPVRSTKPLPVNNDRVRQLTNEEYERLMAVLTPEHRIEVEFALHTGGRRWNQFDLEWEHLNDTAYFKKTKNGLPQHVHVNSYLRGLVAQLPRKGRYVFQDSHDEILRNNKLNWWYDALEAAGIKDFRWHDLRHTFASRLAQKGASLRTIQEALNQKSPQMAVRYAHLTETHMRDALEGLVG